MDQAACTLGSGENWKRWVLIGPDSFSGGFRVLEHNKSETKLFRTFFDMGVCVRKKSV